MKPRKCELKRQPISLPLDLCMVFISDDGVLTARNNCEMSKSCYGSHLMHIIVDISCCRIIYASRSQSGNTYETPLLGDAYRLGAGDDVFNILGGLGNSDFFRFKSRIQHETVTHLKALPRTVDVCIGVGFLSAYLGADMGTYPRDAQPYNPPRLLFICALAIYGYMHCVFPDTITLFILIHVMRRRF